MPRWVEYLLLALVVFLLGSITLSLQSENGLITGVITDERGAVAGATVQARNVMSGALVTVVSDRTGSYKIEALRAGRYTLWVTLAGHDSVWIPEIVVERGRTVQKDVRIAVTRGKPTS